MRCFSAGICTYMHYFIHIAMLACSIPLGHDFGTFGKIKCGNRSFSKLEGDRFFCIVCVCIYINIYSIYIYIHAVRHTSKKEFEGFQVYHYHPIGPQCIKFNF